MWCSPCATPLRLLILLILLHAAPDLSGASEPVGEDTIKATKQHGVVVGEAGNIWSTMTGGYGWVPQKLAGDLKIDLMGVFVHDDSSGVAVGGGLLRDHGSPVRQRKCIQIGPSSECSHRMLNLLDRWQTVQEGTARRAVVFSSAITQWAVLRVDPPRTQCKCPASRARRNICRIVAPLKVKRPAGAEWKKAGVTDAGSGGENLRELNDVTFCNSTVGIIVGSNGAILRSGNSGSSWGVILSGTQRDLKSVACFSATEAIIVGDSVALRTVDGGRTWRAPGIPPASTSLNGLIMRRSAYAIAVGASAFATSDAGQTWTSVDVKGVLPVSVVSTSFASVRQPTRRLNAASFHYVCDTQ
jgi:hypothetical protein